MTYWKKSSEETPVEDTPIWTCDDGDCKGWMRDNFSFQNEPTCPLCNSTMTKDSKMLPQLVNNSLAEPKPNTT